MGNALQTLSQIPQQQQQHQESANNDGGENGEEFTCEICIEPTSYSDKKFKNSDECSHPFCTDCMVKYIRVKLEDDNAARIRCPALSCDRELDPRACASLVGPSLFARWCDLLCEETILGWNRCYCPNRNCNALIVNECGGGIVGKSKCPQCKRRFCFECGRVWHAGFACGDNVDANDVAFGRLAEIKKWMRCPRCRRFVELRNGCRIVKCRCGINFCYNCGDQYDWHRCRCDTDTAAGRCSRELCSYGLFVACIFIFLLVMWLVRPKLPDKEA